MSTCQQLNSKNKWICPTADTGAPGAIEAPDPNIDKHTHIATAQFDGDIFTSWKIQTKQEYADEQEALAQPTTQQLHEQARRQLQKDRDTALTEAEYTFSDGRVVQVRPQDRANFEVAIAAGQDKNWVMKDNTIRLTTVTEMQDALESGISQAETIWDQYAQDLDALNSGDTQ